MPIWCLFRGTTIPSLMAEKIQIVINIDRRGCNVWNFKIVRNLL